MRRYESYKDSGVEWLRQIPSHWDMQRSKFIFKKIERKVNEEDQIVTCFRDGQVTLRANRRTEGFTNALKEHGYQGIRKGDLVIHAMDAFAGAIGVSDSDGKATPVYSVCLPHDKQKIDVYFYAYYLRNLALSGFISSLAKGIRERSTDFRYADFAELLLPIPPYLEQQKIAQFLDDKTAKIEQAVDLAEKQIALLKEHKQILIQNAVTRGLNPDVPLKDSGVEWIGLVPEHWEVKKLKYLGNAIIGLTYSPDDLCDESEGILVARSSNIQNGSFVYSDNVYVKKQIPKKLQLKEQDILICSRNGSRDLIGKCAYITKDQEKHTFGAFTTVFRSKYNPYLFYILNSEIFKRLSGNFLTSTINQLTINNLNSIQVALPPLLEQKKIANCLEVQTAKIDQAIALKTAHIEKLKEYKSVLINDVVTGKVRVSV